MAKKRARNEAGRFIPDDKTTPYINEAYEQTWVAKVRQFLWIPSGESFVSFFWRFLIWVFRG